MTEIGFGRRLGVSEEKSKETGKKPRNHPCLRPEPLGCKAERTCGRGGVVRADLHHLESRLPDAIPLMD